MLTVFLLRLLKRGLALIFFTSMFVSTVSFSDQIVEDKNAIHKWTQLSNKLRSLKGTIKVDRRRRRSISKIMEIAGLYNPQMPWQKQDEIANEIYEMSIKYPNLDIELICATITHESGLTWRPDVQSWAGAMGLMQIIPETGRFLCDLEGIEWTNAEEILYDPIQNIRLGCRYLSMLIESYQLEGGLAAYNGGERRVALWLASGRDNRVLYKETQKYIPAVLKLYELFKSESSHS